MAYQNKNGIKIQIEKETLTDGSKGDNVVIRWDGGFMKIAACSQEHAERLFVELGNAAYIDTITWEKSADANRRTERR